MATFLTGVQALARECGVGSEPSSVLNQTGEAKRLVEWYRDSWTELQTDLNWRWMRREFTLNTVADDDKYAYSDCTDVDTAAAISRFRTWNFEDPWDPPRIYLQSAGVGTENHLQWLPWNEFRYLYKTGSAPSGFPAFVTIDPQDNIRLGPAPNGVYVVSGEYWRGPQTLTAASDEPEMPAHYHNLILYMAMERYGYYEAAEEVLARARERGRKLRIRLAQEQGPRWSTADPMI